MNLKPMDENTLAFLRDLIECYQLPPIEGSKFFKGMDAQSWMCLVMATRHFSELGFHSMITNDDLLAFMEAIKNADSKH